MRRSIGWVVACCVVWSAGCASVPRASAPDPSQPPSIVIIFTDDQGYGDVGCFGATAFATPHLDRMAAQGVRLTSFYAAQPVCSASRAALLTGCYPNRIGIAGALGPGAAVGLSPDETTLAELCRERGYTTVILGKWHLGDAPAFWPTRHGFDEFYGLPYSNDMWPMHPELAGLEAAERRKRYPPLPLLESVGPGGEVRVIDAEVTPEDQAELTRDITARAVRFIEGHRDRPFLLYIAHPMPHVPLYGAPPFEGRTVYGRYGDIVEEIDWSVGEVLAAIERAGLDERTLVVFTADNGPWLSYGTHAGTTGGLREGKGTTWEGGVRVPFIARWPGRIPAGGTSDEPAMTIDLLPTVAGLIGAAPPGRRIDGLDIWPLLAGSRGVRSPHEALLFYYGGNSLEAIRAGRWKLVFPHRYRSLLGAPGTGGRPAGYTQRSCGLELYDLASDPGETRDVARRHPDVVGRLMGLANGAREDLGDDLASIPGRGRRPAGGVD